LPDYTSVVVRPQSNLVLHTLPDVVTEFFDSIPPLCPESPQQESESSFQLTDVNEIADIKPLIWKQQNPIFVRPKLDPDADMLDSGSSLEDLDCLTDLLDGGGLNSSSNGSIQPIVLTTSEPVLKLGWMDDDDRIDSCWESGSSSSSGGSHFEFSCTQDVSDMLSDIGVSEWGVDDIMMIKTNWKKKNYFPDLVTFNDRLINFSTALII